MNWNGKIGAGSNSGKMSEKFYSEQMICPMQGNVRMGYSYTILLT